MSDLIIEGAKGIPDGLYVIKDGELFKYKPNGGSVRSYHVTDRPRGEWKQIEINGYPYAVCDQCHLLADIVEKDGELVMSMANADEKCANFCPNCGADMRGDTERC